MYNEDFRYKDWASVRQQRLQGHFAPEFGFAAAVHGDFVYGPDATWKAEVRNYVLLCKDVKALPVEPHCKVEVENPCPLRTQKKNK